MFYSMYYRISFSLVSIWKPLQGCHLLCCPCQQCYSDSNSTSRSLVLHSCFLRVPYAPESPSDMYLSPCMSVTAEQTLPREKGKKIHAHTGSSFPIAFSPDPEDALPRDPNASLGTSQYFEFFLKRKEKGTCNFPEATQIAPCALLHVPAQQCAGWRTWHEPAEIRAWATRSVKWKTLGFISVTYTVDSGRTEKTEAQVSPDSEMLLLKCCSKLQINLTLTKWG